MLDSASPADLSAELALIWWEMLSCKDEDVWGSLCPFLKRKSKVIRAFTGVGGCQRNNDQKHSWLENKPLESRREGFSNYFKSVWIAENYIETTKCHLAPHCFLYTANILVHLSLNIYILLDIKNQGLHCAPVFMLYIQAAHRRGDRNFVIGRGWRGAGCNTLFRI